MQLLYSYVKLMEKINKVTLWAVAGLLMAIFGLTFIQVFFRFIIHSSLSWSEEAARYVTIWMVFLAVALCIRRQSLIAVLFLVESVSERANVVLRVMVLLITAAFSIYLIVYGTDLAMGSEEEISIAMGMPMWMAYAAIPVGGSLSLLNALVVLIETSATGRGEHNC